MNRVFFRMDTGHLINVDHIIMVKKTDSGGIAFLTGSMKLKGTESRDDRVKLTQNEFNRLTTYYTDEG